MQMLLRRRFQVLLGALLLLLVLHPFLAQMLVSGVLFNAFVSLVFLAAMVVLFKDKHPRVLALVLGVPTVLGAWLSYALPGTPDPPATVTFHLVATFFFGFTVTIILRTIYQEETVSIDSIYGAFCGYLLVAIAFGHLYCCLETLTPGSFRRTNLGNAVLIPVQDRHYLLTYFSIITLTTVGFGDITPVKEAGEGLAAVEAVIGQFYVAVLVAELIGQRVSQAIAAREANTRNNTAPPPVREDSLGGGEKK